MPAEIRKLSDCADILPGYSLKARMEHEPEGTHQVVMAKHIQEGMIYEYKEHHRLMITPTGPADRYMVFPGDVLFISRGTRSQAVVVRAAPDKTIASATLYILRVKDDVDPSYLAWTLNQSPLQSQITQMRTAAGTPIVQRSLMRELKVPVPSLAVQMKIVDVGLLMLRENDIQTELVGLTNLKHDYIGKQLLGQLAEKKTGDSNEH